jgi:hypothetical protein
MYYHDRGGKRKWSFITKLVKRFIRQNKHQTAIRINMTVNDVVVEINTLKDPHFLQNPSSGVLTPLLKILISLKNIFNKEVFSVMF